MKVVKFSSSFIITLLLIFFLNNSWTVGKSPIPALGRFLDPFHGFWQNIESKSFIEPESLKIPGLKEPVTVSYDSLLIPHIFAKNDDDLYLAQGYITAKHRLWQMEIQIFAAAGRVSEIIGEGSLDYDRKQRRLGMVFGAEHAIETMMANSEIKNAILQYTKGVNAYIDNLSANELPFEYKLLNYKPEPWTPLKMGLLLKNLSQTLNMSDNDIEMTNALKMFGKDVVNQLYFDSEKNIGDPIVSNVGGWKFLPVKIDSIPLAVPEEFITLPSIGPKTKGIGSNNWAANGTKTTTGTPILCNDPHLNLSFPSIWFVTHLNAPGVNVMGATLTGCPGIVIGFNDSIAWGVTNGQRDLVDWYRIQFDDEKRNRYMSDGKWREVQKRIEEIKIKGKDSFYDTVVYTHHGPVVYDKSFHADNARVGYAFRWLAHDGSNEVRTLWELNRGKNHNDYMKALNNWSGPAQNFVFASRTGDIAMRIQGKFPVRRKNEGNFVMDGTKTSTEWKAFIPADQNVMIKNPPRGFVSSANQFPADSTYPYHIWGVRYETYRNRRINQVLGQSEKISVQTMMSLQNDTYNLQAAESLPLMLSLLDKNSLQGTENQMVVAMSSWDFYNTVESLPASYYEAWWNTLIPVLWDEMRQDAEMDFPTDYVTIKMMKQQPDLQFYDIASTPVKEDLKAVVNLSFHDAMKKVTEWETAYGKHAQWADFKDTQVQHLLRLGPLGEHVRVGGGSSIVNAAGPRSAPSWRMIVSLEKEGMKAWGVYPGGQSGNPGSKYYNNMVSSWANGKYYQLKFVNSPDAMKTEAISTTLISPEK
jgi:penicillin amidase